MPSIIKNYTAVIRLRESQANLAAKKAEAEKNKPLPALNPVEIPERKKNAPYTDHETATVIKLFPDTPTAEVGKVIGRSEASVRQFAARIDLKKSAEYLAKLHESKRAPRGTYNTPYKQLRAAE